MALTPALFPPRDLFDRKGGNPHDSQVPANTEGVILVRGGAPSANFQIARPMPARPGARPGPGARTGPFGRPLRDTRPQPPNRTPVRNPSPPRELRTPSAPPGWGPAQDIIGVPDGYPVPNRQFFQAPDSKYGLTVDDYFTYVPNGIPRRPGEYNENGLSGGDRDLILPEFLRRRALERRAERVQTGEQIQAEPAESTRDRNRRRRRGDPVALATGAFIDDWIDFRIPGTLPLSATRFYEHGIGLDGPLGRNRTSFLDVTVTVTEENTLLLRDEEGVPLTFERPFSLSESGHPLRRELRLSAPWLRELVLGDGSVSRHFRQGKDRVYRLEAITDGNGNRLVIERDARGLATRARHSDGYELAFENDARGLRRLVSRRSADGALLPLARYAYDEARNLVRVDCTTEWSFRYEYDGEGRITAWSDGSGRTRSRIRYDGEGRVCGTDTSGPWDGDSFDYDGAARTVTHRSADGAADTYTLDEAGEIVAEENALGETRRFLFADGHLASATDGAGNVTRFRHDRDGNVKEVTAPDGRVTLLRWDAPGRLAAVVDQTGAAWRAAFDGAGNRTAIRDPLGRETTFAYTPAGRLASVSYPDGRTERYAYDERHRLTILRDAAGGLQRFAYDSFDRLVSRTDAEGNRTSFDYGPSPSFEAPAPGPAFTEARLVRLPDGRTIRRSFDAEGQLTSVSETGREQRFGYEGFDQLVSIHDAKGGTLRLAYDRRGRLVRLTNAAGRSYRLERDAAGRVVAEEDFDGRRTLYRRDAAGRVMEKTTPDGRVLRFAFDASGRLLSNAAFSGPDAAEPMLVERYGYDDRGLLAWAEGADATVSIERDRAGAVIAETVDGHVVRSAFDDAGLRTRRTLADPAGEVHTTSYAYDALGRLADLAGGTGVAQSLSIERDALGRQRRIAVGAVALTQEFDALGRLAFQSVGGGGGPRGGALGQGYERRFGYDAAGLLSELSDPLWGAKRFGRDANGQVVEALHAIPQAGGLPRLGGAVLDRGFGEESSEAETFAYGTARDIERSGGAVAGEPLGRQTAWLSSPGGRVQMARGPRGERVTLRHDEAGRLVERRVERDGFRPQVWHYGWDGFDRLVEARTPQGATWRYRYDPFGRRIEKRSASGGTRFVWDGDTLARAVSSGAGGAASAVFHVADADGSTLAIEQEGELRMLVNDHLGVPRELLRADGALAWSADTWLWGARRADWTAPAGGGAREPPALDDGPCPLGFPGQWHDRETGLLYNRHRFYDPLTGQYASTDPIGLAGGPRPGAYVEDPTSETDPLGLDTLRGRPGIATGSGRPAGDPWLRGTGRNAAYTPTQVAARLRGREFSSFDEYRKAYWKAVADTPELAEQFAQSDRTLMSQGLAPFASRDQQVGGMRNYNLHHIRPIWAGGGVYDADNIMVVTPRFHQEVLDPRFHYNR